MYFVTGWKMFVAKTYSFFASYGTAYSLIYKLFQNKVCIHKVSLWAHLFIYMNSDFTVAVFDFTFWAIRDIHILGIL